MFTTQLWHHVKCKNALWSTSQLILCVDSKSFLSLHNPEVWAYSACTAANLHTIIIDSSTTSHIHSNWAHFKSLKSSSSSINVFGDGSRSIQGHGKAQLYITYSPLIVYEFFCFKIETNSRVDLYSNCPLHQVTEYENSFNLWDVSRWYSWCVPFVPVSITFPLVNASWRSLPLSLFSKVMHHPLPNKVQQSASLRQGTEWVLLWSFAHSKYSVTWEVWPLAGSRAYTTNHLFLWKIYSMTIFSAQNMSSILICHTLILPHKNKW